MTDYKSQYLDPRWQKKRLHIMERDGFKCLDCESTTTTLNIHHTYYVPGRMVWDYPDFCFQTLCAACHKASHNHTNTNDGECWQSFEYAMQDLAAMNVDVCDLAMALKATLSESKMSANDFVKGMWQFAKSQFQENRNRENIQK